MDFSFLLFGPLYVVGSLFLNIKKNKTLNTEPANLKTLWRWANKKTAPRPEVSSYLFAFQVTLFFSYWESFVMDLVDLQKPTLLRVLACLALVAELFVKKGFFECFKYPGKFQSNVAFRSIVWWLCLYGGPLALLSGLWLSYRQAKLLSKPV